ncbi:Phosphoribosyl-AMP cyclohydrolase [Candidatus Hodgkinia cicadicola]|nr:Phosphoribosyl-AMP cyclohydrolase [Candidatus Hodgkinia cicadicola]
MLIAGVALMFAYVNKLRLRWLGGFQRTRLGREASASVHGLAEACADCGSDLLLFGVVMFCEGYSRCNAFIIACDSGFALRLCVAFWLMPLMRWHNILSAND